MVLVTQVPLTETVAALEARIGERANAQPPHPLWPDMFELEARLPFAQTPDLRLLPRDATLEHLGFAPTDDNGAPLRRDMAAAGAAAKRENLVYVVALEHTEP